MNDGMSFAEASHMNGAAQRPHVFERPSASHAIDFSALAAELDTVIRTHAAGARTQPAPTDVVLRHGAICSIASFAIESDRIARAVVSHVRVWPLFQGIAMVVHPRAEIDAPLLVADLMEPPALATTPRAFIDVCGPAIARAPFATRFREPLAAILDGAHVPRRAPVPAWIAPVSGGAGGRLSARRGSADVLASTLSRYLARYLEAVAQSASAADPAANRAVAKDVARIVRASGPAGRYLARAFGRDYAARFLDLLWQAD
jgi:hypothetical protein